jgi:hypothetical protein
MALTAVLSLQACSTVRLPSWVDHPCEGEPPDARCATGESELVSVSVEAGKSDAEVAAVGRLQLQVQAELDRRPVPPSAGPTPVESGEGVQLTGQLVLRGVRFTDYHFEPNRAAPRRLFVRAVLSPELVSKAMDDAEAARRAAPSPAPREPQPVSTAPSIGSADGGGAADGR